MRFTKIFAVRLVRNVPRNETWKIFSIFSWVTEGPDWADFKDQICATDWQPRFPLSDRNYGHANPIPVLAVIAVKMTKSNHNLKKTTEIMIQFPSLLSRLTPRLSEWTRESNLLHKKSDQLKLRICCFIKIVLRKRNFFGVKEFFFREFWFHKWM